MQLYEISFQPNVDSKVRADLQKLVEESTTVEELLAGWPIDDEQSITFGTGLDDQDPELQLIAVEFKHAKTLVAEVYFTRDEPSKVYPFIVPMINYKVGYSQHGGIKFDEEAWDRWHVSLGFEFSDALCDNIGPHSALLPYLMSFILTDGGYVSVSKADYMTDPDIYADDIADLKAEGIDPDKVLVVHAGYLSPTPVGGAQPGWVTTVYFHMIESDKGVVVTEVKHMAS